MTAGEVSAGEASAGEAGAGETGAGEAGAGEAGEASAGEASAGEADVEIEAGEVVVIVGGIQGPDEPESGEMSEARAKPQPSSGCASAPSARLDLNGSALLLIWLALTLALRRARTRSATRV
jgi:hypothetical protein